MTHALPGRLPAGERVLWQGKPEWRALARDALHLRGLSLYFAALVASVGIAAAWRGAPALEVVRDTALAALITGVPVALGLLYAWASARGTTYTITNRRVVMRIGVALPMTFNLPFARIADAGLRTRAGGGEIRLRLIKTDGLSSVMLWPHARLGHAQPMLRGIVEAERVGHVLARALAATVDAPVPLAPAAVVVDTAPDRSGITTVAA